jgi:thiamine-monophosphate kinase
MDTLPSLLSSIGEKEIIRTIIKPLLNPNDDPNSIGDDCAVIEVGAGNVVCISTDRVPADLISFRLGIIKYRGLGYYLVVLNLSDLAAMGAKPLGILLNLGLPSDMQTSELLDLLKGAKDACDNYGCSIIGGDLSNASELSISATSLGINKADSVLRRRGARKGDAVYCSDYIGLTATAFSYFLKAKKRGLQLSETDETLLMNQFRNPKARFDLSHELIKSRQRATAMDNTDGVGQTLLELAEINKMAIRIDSHRLPIHEISHKVAAFLQMSPIDLVLEPGADFQLIGTINPAALSNGSLPTVIKIGEAIGGQGLFVCDDSGNMRALEVVGWNYFLQSDR